MKDQNLDVIKTPAQLVKIKSEILHQLMHIQKEYAEIVNKIKLIGQYVDSDIIKMEINKYSLFSNTEEDRRKNIERADERLSKACWEYYANKSGILDLMTDKDKRKYNESLKNTKKFDETSAIAWLNSMNDRYLNTVDNLFKETFESLIRYKYGHWSNQKSRNNTKVEPFFILGGICHTSYGFRLYNLSDNCVLNHLERCLCLIDTKQPKQYPNRISDRVNAMKEGKFIENEYFKLKLHKNGNVHVTITNL